MRSRTRAILAFAVKRLLPFGVSTGRPLTIVRPRRSCGIFEKRDGSVPFPKTPRIPFRAHSEDPQRNFFDVFGFSIIFALKHFRKTNVILVFIRCLVETQYLGYDGKFGVKRLRIV